MRGGFGRRRHKYGTSPPAATASYGVVGSPAGAGASRSPGRRSSPASGRLSCITAPRPRRRRRRRSRHPCSGCTAATTPASTPRSRRWRRPSSDRLGRRFETDSYEGAGHASPPAAVGTGRGECRG
ncbi:MAG: hypothetical protein MZV70_56805 [Desulfobacterales bacterium]|nr:hypothetical protein [Desulfobacterales bacterium]